MEKFKEAVSENDNKQNNDHDNWDIKVEQAGKTSDKIDLSDGINDTQELTEVLKIVAPQLYIAMGNQGIGLLFNVLKETIHGKNEVTIDKLTSFLDSLDTNGNKVIDGDEVHQDMDGVVDRMKRAGINSLVYSIPEKDDDADDEEQ